MRLGSVRSFRFDAKKLKSLTDRIQYMPCVIIAEAGVNHNGSLDTAFELVEAAHACGADVVKFQSFRPTELVSAKAAKAQYQETRQAPGSTQREMLEAFQLSLEAIVALKRFSDRLGIRFLSTPFDITSLHELTDVVGLRTLKISSGDITNGPLLAAAASRADSILLSTGMSTLQEVQAAVRLLSSVRASTGRGDELTDSSMGDDLKLGPLCLLHCVSAYPTRLEDVNLRAIGTLESTFAVPVGFSDHTLGIEAALASVALGAVVVEKHLTLDPSWNGPDHAASLDPVAFEAMCRGIRAVELSLGSPSKMPVEAERDALWAGRRSLRAAKDIAEGHVITAEDVSVLRPGDGRSPMEYWDLLGTRASRSYEVDDCFE